MANKQIDMRKIKQIFKLYSEGVSKRKISLIIGLRATPSASILIFLNVTTLPATKCRL